MRPTLFWAMVIILLLGSQPQGPTVPKPLSPLDSKVFQPRTKAPVLFRHRPHEAAGVACTACHHVYERGRNLWRQGQPVQPCQECHHLQPAAGGLDLKNAFHRQCKGCHLKLRGQRRGAGPVRCEECHRSD